MPIKLFYKGNYQTLGDNEGHNLYVCSVRVVLRQEFKWLRKQVVGKWCHFGQYLSNTCLTQMVNSVRIKPKLLSFVWSLRRETNFLSPKSCLNDTAMAITLHQSNHQYFLMKVCSYRKVEVQYCDKRSSFPGVTARNVKDFTYFDRFPSQEGGRICCHCSCILMRVGPTYNSS